MMSEKINELYVDKELFRLYVNNCVSDEEPHLAFIDWLIKRKSSIKRTSEVTENAD